MTNQPLCDQCNQRQSCRDLYQKLGQDKGPSIMRSVLAAFLLPIVVFIAALAASQHFLVAAVQSGNARTIIALPIAVLAVILCVLITRAINIRLAKRKQ